MAYETTTPAYFTSWSFMEQDLRTTFLLANVAYRHSSSFLRNKQGEWSPQELHNHEAAMAGAPRSDDVKVTVFIVGVRTVRFGRSSSSVSRSHLRRWPTSGWKITACAQRKDTRPMSKQVGVRDLSCRVGTLPADPTCEWSLLRL
ncbi:hypothetical protein PR003_g8210 [Phytophthora rubi]|uniref:Uncharacterized protein n=1 Tax=Phytophthora rubi TaxID=129364 RepID=A0A6A4FW00_9STRA|nr:hypothetical protein PR003_g8210 [Phytophthora rubi]